MLIYQDWHKSSGDSANRGSHSLDFEQLSSPFAHNNSNNNNNKNNNCEGRKKSTTTKTILTRANTNFLRSLGFRVRQYKELKQKYE